MHSFSFHGSVNIVAQTDQLFHFVHAIMSKTIYYSGDQSSDDKHAWGERRRTQNLVNSFAYKWRSSLLFCTHFFMSKMKNEFILISCFICLFMVLIVWQQFYAAIKLYFMSKRFCYTHLILLYSQKNMHDRDVLPPSTTQNRSLNFLLPNVRHPRKIDTIQTQVKIGRQMTMIIVCSARNTFGSCIRNWVKGARQTPAHCQLPIAICANRLCHVTAYTDMMCKTLIEKKNARRNIYVRVPLDPCFVLRAWEKGRRQKPKMYWREQCCNRTRYELKD